MRKTGGIDDFFWQVAAPLLERDGVTRGTMMGYPCLRTDGEFFASADRHSGDLVVKLPASRVQELIAEGIGEPFAPAGHPFREWVQIPARDVGRWELLLQEALHFVSTT